MTILSIVQDAAVMSLGLERPSTLFTNTSRTWVEMQALVNDCAKQILEDYNWSLLKKVATVTSNGTMSFPLPADFDQMVVDAHLWGPNRTWYPSEQIPDFNQWLGLATLQPEPWQQRWSIYGGQLHVLPILAASDPLTYGYISNWIVNGTQTDFTADSDTFVLDERLLKLSIIWNWKSNKGQDYSSDLQKYEEAMAQARFKDTGTRPTIRSSRMGNGTRGFR